MNAGLAAPSTDSALAKSLAAGLFTVTTEVTPPVATEVTRFVTRAKEIQGLATAVNVTDGAGAKAHLSTIVAAHALLDAGIEPILQMVGRDRNRLALQSDLLGALALGIKNLLVLSGDDPKAGDQPDTKGVFDLNGGAMLSLFAHMRAERKLPPGTLIEGPFDLLLGAADVPADPPANWDAAGLKAKADAGANFIQTQFCMDIGRVRRYGARLVELGLAQRLPVLIGIAPIPSVRSALWMRERLFGTVIPDRIVERLSGAADPKTEGKAICVELIQQLAETPGIAGAHIMAPQAYSTIPEVIAASGVTGKSKARMAVAA
jgi:methylenetetrahydrofolate reductase (NADPH)